MTGKWVYLCKSYADMFYVLVINLHLYRYKVEKTRQLAKNQYHYKVEKTRQLAKNQYHYKVEKTRQLAKKQYRYKVEKTRQLANKPIPLQSRENKTTCK